MGRTKYTNVEVTDGKDKAKKLLEQLKREERKKLKAGWKWVKTEPGTLILRKVADNEKN